jgi:hypothetical protein
MKTLQGGSISLATHFSTLRSLVKNHQAEQWRPDFSQSTAVDQGLCWGEWRSMQSILAFNCRSTSCTESCGMWTELDWLAVKRGGFGSLLKGLSSFLPSWPGHAGRVLTYPGFRSTCNCLIETTKSPYVPPWFRQHAAAA